VLPVLGPAIVSHKLTWSEAINPIDILVLRNLHQDRTPAQEPIRTQAQLKQALGPLVDLLQMALVYHRPL
jgi:hypothetical protein